MEYFVDAFKQYATFTGRATRTQYWMFVLIYLIIAIVLGVIDGLLGIGVLGPIFGLVMLIPSISITARRLHDTGRTGWWQLIYFVPLIGLIVMIIFLVQDSDANNEYGANPKAA